MFRIFFADLTGFQNLSGLFTLQYKFISRFRDLDIPKSGFDHPLLIKQLGVVISMNQKGLFNLRLILTL